MSGPILSIRNPRSAAFVRKAGATTLLIVFSAGSALGKEAPPDTVAAPDASSIVDRWRRGPGPTATVEVLDPLIAERIGRLRATSPTFAAAWAEIEAAGIPVLIGDRAALEGILPRAVRRSDGWAGITVSWSDNYRGDLQRTAVAVRLDWLQSIHHRFDNPPEAFLEALDGILIHEIYGHLVPLIAARNIHGKCEDPRLGERLADSCVGQRELALKRERTRLASAGG